MKRIPKILIIDDEALILDFLVEEFQYEGFEVHKAVSGYSAAPLIQKFQFDAVLTDFRMSDGDGLFVVSLLEKLTIKPCVYFISADGKFIGNQGSNSIIKEYFQKPFKIEQIINRIKKDLQI